MSLFGMIRNTHKLNPGKTVVAYSDNASIVPGRKMLRLPNAFTHKDGRYNLLKKKCTT